MSGKHTVRGDKPLYIPPVEEVKSSLMYKFMEQMEQKYPEIKSANKSEDGLMLSKTEATFPPYIRDSLQRFRRLHKWTVENLPLFWPIMWDVADIKDGVKGKIGMISAKSNKDAVILPDWHYNFARQILRFYNDEVVIRGWCESVHKYEVTHRQLYHRVSVLAQALKDAGVKKGDRVAGVLPNAPGAIIAMLATVSLGAVWSSASPDFGVFGLVDRFGQIEPKIMFCTDHYYYRGKRISCVEKGVEFFSKMPTVKQLVFIPYDESGVDIDVIPAPAISLHNFTKSYIPKQIEYVSTNVNDPLFILYSSGTTGPPKCIMHRVGLLVKIGPEHKLHMDIRPGDRVCRITTCGWMVWNWTVTTLASEATICLYDGYPFYPKPTTMFDFIQEYGVTYFGVSAKFIQNLSKFNVNVKESHPMPLLRRMSSTGSPLLKEFHDYVYRCIKSDIPTSIIYGATDMCSLFSGPNPMTPVWSGEVQSSILGMAVNVFNEKGEGVVGEMGELVVTKPYLSQPIRFYNDPTGEKYRKAYYDRYPGIWCQGDVCEFSEEDGLIIYGRSDAVLLPGGVRIGTAEIYRVVEREDYIAECVAVGRDVADGDMDIVLFVVMRDGIELTSQRLEQLKHQIRTRTTPRHVPKEIYTVKDIPRTKTGKISELAVRDIINNKPVKNTTALDNAFALEYFHPFRTIQPKL